MGVEDIAADPARCREHGVVFGHVPVAVRAIRIVVGVRENRGMLEMRTGRGFLVKRPTKPRVSTALANLRPGQSLVLERCRQLLNVEHLATF